MDIKEIETKIIELYSKNGIKCKDYYEMFPDEIDDTIYIRIRNYDVLNEDEPNFFEDYKIVDKCDIVFVYKGKIMPRTLNKINITESFLLSLIEEECPVCYKDLSTDTIHCTTCSKRFCADCIKKIFELTNVFKCPNCRCIII